MKRRRGFLMFEVLCALGLIVVAALIWVSATSRVHRADAGLADGRDATYAAERALLVMRSGAPLPSAAGAAKLTAEPCDGGTAIDGHAWVYVEATVGNQKRGLVGLVPMSAMKRGGQ
jgi:hypothetical protein